MEESAEDSTGSVSSSLNFSQASLAQCPEDVAVTLVPDLSMSIGSSDTVDIVRLLFTFAGLGPKVETALFLVTGCKASDDLGSLLSGLLLYSGTSDKSETFLHCSLSAPLWGPGSSYWMYSL